MAETQRTQQKERDWRVYFDKESEDYWIFEQGVEIAFVCAVGNQDQKANAEFIVTAVNNFDRLVEALREAVNYLTMEVDGYPASPQEEEMVMKWDALLKEIGG